LALAGTSFEQSLVSAHVCVEGGAVVVVVALAVVVEDVAAATQAEPDSSKPERQPVRGA